MRVRIKKLNEKAIVPTYGSKNAAGADLYALSDTDIVIEPGTAVLVHTGLAFEIPEGYVGLVFARSGLATKRGLAPSNKVGVIDADYRGELMVSLFNQSSITQTIQIGERIAQFVVTPYLACEFEESDSLEETERGTGGFGSTGTK